MLDFIRCRRESVLRTLYSSEAGLIVHCSAVKDDSLSYIFPGVADVGKSTLAEKLNKIMPVINDDMNILEFAENEKIKVSTYFTQAENRGYHYIINENISGILKAVFFPVKELKRDSFLEPIYDKGLIWTTLLTCTATPLRKDDLLFSKYLEMIDKFINAVPFFNIHHNLKDSPDFIAGLLRKTNENSST